MIKLDDSDREFAKMMGVPEEQLLRQKQEAFEQGIIDEDGKVIGNPLEAMLEGLKAKLKEHGIGINVSSEDDDDDFECDGDCENCSRSHGDGEDENSALMGAAERHKDLINEALLDGGKAAFDSMIAKIEGIAEADKELVKECVVNAIMNTVGPVSGYIHHGLRAYMKV